MRLLAIACCLMLGGAAGCGGDEGERPAAVDPDDPVSAPAAPAPDAGDPTPPRACRRLGRRLVGTTLADARERAERRGCALRVAVLDGEPQALTEDFQPARINVRVRDDIVAALAFMG